MILSKEASDFAREFEHITENPVYKDLRYVPRHGSTNTYDHSIRVAKMAYKMALRCGVDSVSAARVGLLHDFCMIDYHRKDIDKKEIHNGEWYCFYHPIEAIENSAQYMLTDTEKQAIKAHMFPLSKSIPKSRLAIILSLSDKFVATYESYASLIELYFRIKLSLNGIGYRMKKIVVDRKKDYKF